MSRCTGLGAAYLSHWLTLILGSVVFFFYYLFIAYMMFFFLNESTPFDSYGSLLSMAISEIGKGIQHSQFWVGLTITLLVIEVGFLALAIILLPWGANHEPVGQSVRRALRTVWLSTTLLFAWLATFFTSFVAFEILRRTLSDSKPWDAQSLLIRDPKYVLGWVACAISSGVLVILFLAIATKTSDEPAGEPPICERCGYNLSHTPVESRCPECGESAAASIAQPRQPTDWEASNPKGWIRAYFRCGMAAICRPSSFFKAMPTQTGHSGARGIGLLHLIHAGLWAVPVIAGQQLLAWGVDRGRWHPNIVHDLLGLTYMPFITFGCLLVLMGILATISGLYLSWQHKRPLLAPAAKVFFYASSIFVVWMAAGLVIWDSLCLLSRSLPKGIFPMFEPHGIHRDAQGPLLGIPLIALALLAWLLIVRRGLRQVVYANT